tara:strand:+ start:13867 stop:14316 length:450 start_codon:yes stop_codon:yes gene_type:complete
MPKSRVSRKKLFRDFSKLDKRYVKRNYLKNIYKVYKDLSLNHNISKSEIELLLFIYDLEFFTLDYLSQAMGKSLRQLTKSDKGVYPLISEGYIYKHFDKLTPSQTMEDHIFREETKFNYRVRYALSQKGRLLVQRVYRKLEGEDPIIIS